MLIYLCLSITWRCRSCKSKYVKLKVLMRYCYTYVLIPVLHLLQILHQYIASELIVLTFSSHVQPTSFGLDVLEFCRVFPRPGSLRTKLSLCYRLHNQVPSSPPSFKDSIPSRPLLEKKRLRTLLKGLFINEVIT